MKLRENHQIKSMQAALDEAQKAADQGEVPIGAVVVWHDKIIGRGHNLREVNEDATEHAEMIAIREACAYLDSWRLEEAEIYVTVEPCPMCAGAIINSRLEKVYYGTADFKAGVVGSFMNLLTDKRFNHQPKIVFGGLMAIQAQQAIKQFFKTIRKKKKLAKRASNSNPNQVQ